MQHAFDLCLQGMLTEAAKERRVNETIEYLEQMIGHTVAYWHIDEGQYAYFDL